MKIGAIGLGNMATAIIGGLLAKKMVEPENVIGFDKFDVAINKIKSKYKNGICFSDSVFYWQNLFLRFFC